jgi:hypothetical protein
MTKRTLFTTLAAAGVVTTAAVALAATTHSADAMGDCPKPRVTVSPHDVTSGSIVSITGIGFCNVDDIHLEVIDPSEESHGDGPTVSIDDAGDGTFHTRMLLSGAPGKTYTAVVTGWNGQTVKVPDVAEIVAPARQDG